MRSPRWQRRYRRGRRLRQPEAYGRVPEDWSEGQIRQWIQDSQDNLNDWPARMTHMIFKHRVAASGAGAAYLAFSTAAACREARAAVEAWYAYDSSTRYARMLQVRFMTPTSRRE